MVSIPQLPVDVTLHGGLEITIRALRRDEIRLYFDVLRAAAADGAGYGYDELTSFDYFVRYYVDNFCNVVYEARTSPSDGGRRIIAFTGVGPSGFSRDRDAFNGDGNAVILPEYRGKKLAREIYTLHVGITAEIGRKGMFGEMSSNNVPNMKVSNSAGWVTTGSIPNAIFFKDSGWVDLITGYYPQGSIVPFGEQIDRSRSQL